MISFKDHLYEGGDSAKVRYNTEISALLVFANNNNAKEFDPTTPELFFDVNKIHFFDATMENIRKFLVPVYDKKLFDSYYQSTLKSAKVLNMKPSMLSWIGGANATGDEANPADVEFLNDEYFGVSVKDSGGITLSNLSPKKIGVSGDLGEDVIQKFAVMTGNKSTNVFSLLKKRVFIAVVRDVKKIGYLSPKKNKYSISYDENSKMFEITYKGNKKIALSEKEILSEANYEKNILWHRVFGDYLVENKSVFNKHLSLMYKNVSRGVIEIIKSKLANSTDLFRILNIGVKPYLYQTPKYSYRVPSVSEIKDMDIKINSIKITPGDLSSGVRFVIDIGTKDSEKNATLDLYIRYANGVYSANPTVRVQSLKNPENIFWRKL